MENLGISGLLLLLFTVFVSYKGFNSSSFFARHEFQVGRILLFKENYRLFTSAFLHVSWLHLFFNMVSLYFFCGILQAYVGPVKFLLVYFISLLGGSLLSLFLNRHNHSYTAIGASGAVAGIIFASIALVPSLQLGFPGTSLAIPGWLYGTAYVLITIWGIKAKTGNIGHEAHLGGAISGLVVAIAMVPEALRHNYLTILLILLPAAAFLFHIIRNPDFIVNGRIFERAASYQTIEDKHNAAKRKKERELDQLLEKIHARGIESLSKKEREMLDRHACEK